MPYITGPTGSMGYQGVQGARGPQGIPGETIIHRVTGATGPSGTAGTGIQGSTGSIGYQGVQGARGPQGIPGETIIHRVTGPQGLAGLDGIDGLDGATGYQGVQGVQGFQGSTGPSDHSLLTGLQGGTGTEFYHMSLADYNNRNLQTPENYQLTNNMTNYLGTVYTSHLHPEYLQTVQTLGIYAINNTVGDTTLGMFDARTIPVFGGGIASVGFSAGSFVVSAIKSMIDGGQI